MLHRCLAVLVVAPVVGATVFAQGGPGNQQPPFKNELLDNLQGVWRYESPPGAKQVHGGADAVWELGHLWLRLHQQEVDGQESVTYIGFDNYDKRLVAMRMDNISGARGAETNGYGLQEGNKITFTFSYSVTEIRQTFTWDPQAKSWEFLVESKPHRGTTWAPLQSLTLRKVGGRGLGPGPRVLRGPPGAPNPPQ